MTLLGLLLFLIVAGVVVWATRKLLAAFQYGEPLSTVIWVLVVIFVLAAFLNQVGYGPNLGFRLR